MNTHKPYEKLSRPIATVLITAALAGGIGSYLGYRQGMTDGHQEMHNAIEINFARDESNHRMEMLAAPEGSLEREVAIALEAAAWGAKTAVHNLDLAEVLPQRYERRIVQDENGVYVGRAVRRNLIEVYP
jgi:hypothetical protein